MAATFRRFFRLPLVRLLTMTAAIVGLGAGIGWAETNLACTAAPGIPTSVSNLTPLASGLHFLPPLGTVAGGPATLDVSLTDYLEVRACNAASARCRALTVLTSEGSQQGMEHVWLKNKEYSVNWDI